MLDDFRELNLVTWRVEYGTPDPNNPLIEGDMPWDAGGVGIHGSVLKDPIDSLWKAYLVCTPPEEASENKSEPWRSENHFHRRICLFESTDGVNWTRPELPNVPFGEHKTTNIIFDLKEGTSAYSSVLIDPTNQDWPYEIFVLRQSLELPYPEGIGYHRYRSRDSKVWEGVGSRINDPMAGDLCFFYRDPAEGYVAYYRLAAPRQQNDHIPIYEDGPRRSCPETGS